MKRRMIPIEERIKVNVPDLARTTLFFAGKCVAQLTRWKFVLFVFVMIPTLWEEGLLPRFDYSVGVQIDWSAYGE
jgi:hypothetical protein